MALIRFGPLQQAYPFVNLATGPQHQCAIRMSRCFRAAYPEFFEDMLKLGDALPSTLQRELNHSTQNGIIFFQNCFRPAGPNDGHLPGELVHHLDGAGDHIDLHVADRSGRQAPPGSGALARRMHARVSNHMEIWDGRSDQVWFWPLPL